MPTFSSSRSNLPEAKVNIPRLITLTKEVPEMPRIDFVLLLRLTVLAGFVCPKLELSLRKEPSLRKSLHEIHLQGSFSISDQGRGSVVGGDITGLVVLGSI